jgi:hypothetical protein
VRHRAVTGRARARSKAVQKQQHIRQRAPRPISPTRQILPASGPSSPSREADAMGLALVGSLDLALSDRIAYTHRVPLSVAAVAMHAAGGRSRRTRELTFSELSTSLPNGLHDAKLLALRIDYANQAAMLEVEIDLSDTSGRLGEQYALAHLQFTDVQFIVVDAPGPQYDRFTVSRIDAGEGHPPNSLCMLPSLGERTFLCWIFVTDLNSFVRIAARDVEVHWPNAPR